MKKRKAKKINLRKLTIARISSEDFLMLRGGKDGTTKPGTFETQKTIVERTCFPTDENCNVIEYTRPKR